MPVVLIIPRKFEDNRGWFSETYRCDRWSERGVADTFVQDNHSLSRLAGTVRGLHFQTPPHAQAKLIRCISGRIWDVAVDLRKGSPTFGRWEAAELSPDNGHQLYIPEGFAHGFVTLEPDTEVVYKVSAHYAPQSDAGVRWDDPTLALPWPLPPTGATISDKDAVLPLLAEFDSPFAYDGHPLAPIIERAL